MATVTPVKKITGTERSRVHKALSHPLRANILKSLNNGKAVISPNEYSKETKEPLTNVSYHFRMLSDLGMVVLADTEPRRGALEHYYSLNALGKKAVEYEGMV